MPTRAQLKRQAEEAAAAAAAPAAPAAAPEEGSETPGKKPKTERKTTARKSKAKKKEEAAPAPEPEPAPAPAPEPEPAPVEEAAPAAATKEDVIEVLFPTLRISVPEEVPDDALREALDAVLTESTVPLDTLLVLEEEQEKIVAAAYDVVMGPPEAPAESGSAAAAAAAAAAPPTPAPAPPVDDLLAVAKAAKQKRAAAPKPPPPADDEEEELVDDADIPAAASSASASAAAAAASGKSPQDVISIKVPITEQAAQYTIEVKAKTPEPSQEAVPMEASQASASQGTIDEEAAAAPGVFDPSEHSVRWYPVTDAAFPEKLGEQLNLIFPAHKMAPVSWSDMKESHRVNKETYFAFTVAEVRAGYVFGQDYTLLTGDPKKVVAAGVINTHTTRAGVMTVVILDMGTREDAQPKGGAVNPYIRLAIQSLADQMKQFGTVLLRHSRKQMFSDPEYLSTRNTLFSLGIPLSSFTAGGPSGQEALFKLPNVKDPVDVSGVKLALATEGPDRVVYTYREEGTGAEKTFPASAIDRVYVLGRRGIGIAPIVEFVGSLQATKLPIGEGEMNATIPDAVLRDGFKRVEPRRGGRRKTHRKRATSRRSS